MRAALAACACSPLGCEAVTHGQAPAVPATGSAPHAVGAAAHAVATHFERVDAAPCAQAMRVWDLETRTLVLSPKGLRFVEPGQAWTDTRDASAGLPLGRGSTALFASWPLVVEVQLEPNYDGPNETPAEGYERYRWDGERWRKLNGNFGNSTSVFPVHSGSLVIGWFDEKERRRGQPDRMGPNSTPHAWLIAGENAQVSPIAAFPAVPTMELNVSQHTLWAIEERPGHPGYFLMRLPLEGKPSFYLIPGTASCRHLDDGPPAHLMQVTDDSAQLWVLSAGRGCVSKQADGYYAFKGGAFTRFTPPDEPDTRTAQTVTAKQAVFTFDGDSIVVTRNGVVERNAFPNNDPGRPAERARAFELTAGGQEVWVSTSYSLPDAPHGHGRCLLDHYLWPKP